MLAQQQETLRETYAVKKIGIFGSTARGEENSTSDVDVLVEFSRPVGMFQFLDLEMFLTKIIGGKVDLVTKQALKPAIKDSVLREIVYV
ncbi:MAG: nucleotidyltransferase family protein [bacterium]|nr:nucleotidyltransferase family protein [bacterium]